MKIIWHSNAPWIQSGYGNQTDIATRWLHRNGHEVYISGYHGHSGAILTFGGIPVLPSGMEQWGNDMILAHYDFYRPDVFFMLMDSWVVKDQILDNMPASLWCPVDSTPISPPVFQAMQHVRWPVAMSRHGERQMRYTGLDPLYVPHMVETNVYKPSDRKAARAAYGFTDSQFVAVTVAANKGFRKNLDRLLKAWSLFVQDHPDSILFLHTNPMPTQSGADLCAMCDFFELSYHLGSLQPGETLDGVQVALPDMYRMMRGDYTETAMNNLYNAADVFVLPSAGEGFGVPIIEAQSAGCPVAVSDYTSMTELSEVGYRIPIDLTDDLIYNLHDTHQAYPKVSEIRKALDWGWEHRGDAELRAKARSFAMGYDAETVMTRHMMPAFKVMAQGNADYMRYQEYRQPKPTDFKAAAPQIVLPPDGKDTATVPECRENGHDWGQTGVWNKDGTELCAPCRRPDCTAELRRSATGWTLIEDGFKPEINGIPMDIEDDPQGGVAKLVMREIENNYDLDSIDFQPGDVVIDIGAQVGIVSIYLAKKYPFLRIQAFEPSAQNYGHLMRNMIENDVHFAATCEAVTGDGREITLNGDPTSNSGGLSIYTQPNGHREKVYSRTLKDIFEVRGIKRAKLLKIDCEGAEYEILQSAGPEILSKIDHLRGEFHTNARLRALGYDPNQLDALCEQYIPDVKVQSIEIAE